MSTPTQEQLYYQYVRRLGERDELFMELVRDGLTRAELRRNIERRPSHWGRYAGFLKTLPE